MVAPMLFRFAMALICCALLGGCFTPKWKKNAPRPKIVGFPRTNISDGTKGEPRLIGHVAMVNPKDGFVLVDCDLWAVPDPGTALKCFRYGAETGILNSGKEKRGSQVVADIVRGSPQRGDEVFQ